jgi:hypothetical protein
MTQAAMKEHAHELIEQMDPAQVPLVVELLEELLDPLSGKLANAPVDDEPTTEADREAIARSHDAKVISTEELLAGFGLNIADFQRMAENSDEPAVTRG